MGWKPCDRTPISDSSKCTLVCVYPYSASTADAPKKLGPDCVDLPCPVKVTATILIPPPLATLPLFQVP